MENQNNGPTPEHILKITTGFWASKVLLTAANLQLFTMLAEKKSMSAKDIKQTLGLNCSDRNMYDFLDALTALNILDRKGILDDALYSNSTEAEIFLDKKKPSYVGGIVEMMNNRLYQFWGNLGEGLKTGECQNEAKGGTNFFELIYGQPEKLEEFVHAMSGVQMGGFMAFSQKFDFSNYKTLTDAGGSSCLLSLTVAKDHPHMTCVSFDLPAIAPIANKTIQQFQLSDRVKTASGDFFKDDIPSADIVVMGNILHDWDEENKITLMKKAYAALPKGGAFVAIENIIDEDRRNNIFGLLMSLNMLIETGAGFDFTFADFNKWAKLAGFSSTNFLPLAGPTSAAVAIK
jgi:hypothetical protein